MAPTCSSPEGVACATKAKPGLDAWPRRCARHGGGPRCQHLLDDGRKCGLHGGPRGFGVGAQQGSRFAAATAAARGLPRCAFVGEDGAPCGQARTAPRALVHPPRRRREVRPARLRELGAARLRPLKLHGEVLRGAGLPAAGLAGATAAGPAAPGRTSTWARRPRPTTRLPAASGSAGAAWRRWSLRGSRCG